MFYAEYFYYGIGLFSDGDVLMAFETREERDEVVDRINVFSDLHGHGVATAVTTREVCDRYDLSDFENGKAEDMLTSMGKRITTRQGRSIPIINHKPSFVPMVCHNLDYRF